MTNLPQNLNDYNAWVDKGNIKEALDALKNQVAVMVADEPVRRTAAIGQLVKQHEEQGNQIADRLERVIFTLKTDLNRTIGVFEEQTIARLDAYGKEIDTLRTLVEVRTAPFSEVGDHLLLIDDRLSVLEKKATAATPGEEWEAAFNRALDERLKEQRRYLVVRIVAATTVISVIIHFMLFLRM